ncbi:MAG: type I glutamate--ammonia ligase [Anaerolineales bacterium]|nr:MAG: type I glutamate--ammonia ligase [Anaerolineales bacterium]
MALPANIEKLIKTHSPKMVDVRFTDPLGVWQHCSVPIDELEGALKSGIGFDGSSIKGFQQIYDSDLLLTLQPDSAQLDPFYQVPTLTFIATIHDPEQGKRYSRDPRYIAEKAEAFLKESGIAETSYWGPEAEFFLFSHLSYSIEPHSMGFDIDSPEASWNTGAREDMTNLGYRVPTKGGYFPVAPVDTLQDVRSEIALTLDALGAKVEMHHHEVASAGQCEVDLRFDSLVSMADKLLTYKYVVRNVAKAHGLTATFMPKPLFGDNGSGMHVHNSLWSGGKNLFFGKDSYAELSELALHYIGGILTHVDSLLAFCAPTTNSYRRLVPHYEAPVNVAFSKRNRSAIVRIPMYASGEENAKAKRIEFRAPDPTANPYLAFSAILMAGLDGVKRKIDPTKAGYGPLDKNIWELGEEEKQGIRSVPGSLNESVAALEKDHDYLLEGGVFTEDVLAMWKDLKQSEIHEVALRPSPYEFHLYSAI